MTDLSLWTTFICVVDQKNFAKAGRKLRMGSPAITKRIGQLESLLNTRLFNRTTRVVTLTKEGERLVPWARSLLENAGEIERRAQEGKNLSGPIRLTCAPVLAYRWLAPEMAQFLAAHPAVQFELDLSEKVVDLIGEQMDLALRIHTPKGADFIFRELADNELCLCAAPAYLKRSPPILKPEDLSVHSLLILQAFMNSRFKNSQLSLKEFEASRVLRCEVGLFHTEMAINGAGIAVRSRWDVFDHLKSGSLVEVLKDHPLEPYGKAYLVIPQKRFLAARVRAFINHLHQSSHKLSSRIQSAGTSTPENLRHRTTTRRCMAKPVRATNSQ